jgi:hypothetical protein
MRRLSWDIPPMYVTSKLSPPPPPPPPPAVQDATSLDQRIRRSAGALSARPHTRSLAPMLSGFVR